MKTPDINMRDVMADTTITIKVKGTTVFGWRMKLAMFFINVAAGVCPVDTAIAPSIHSKKMTRKGN